MGFEGASGFHPPGGGGGSTNLLIDITRANLLAAIAGSTLIKGAYYAITDFQDKNIADANSRVIVMATSTNTISQTGYWKRLTTNKAYGAFAISAGAGGSVDQVTVAGVPLMTASVPYAVSRINTANNVATNINANSGVSGYQAIVISGETIIDRPAIIIERTTAGVDVGVLAVTVTTLTIANLVNMTMGVAEAEQTLDIAYDITADRIIQCYDSQFDVRMIYTVDQITTLGYNPIVNWRWGHGTFRSWSIIGTGYRNFFDFPSASGVNTLEQNNDLFSGRFDGVVLRRTSVLTRSVSNNTGNLNFINVQLLGNCSINGNRTLLSLTDITSVAGLNILDNFGFENKSIGNVGASSRILLQQTSFATSASFSGNQIGGQIALSSAVCSTTVGISGNICSSITNATATSFLRSLSISSNNIGSVGLTIPRGSGGIVDFAIAITANNFLNGTSGNAMDLFNITTSGTSLLMTRCIIGGVFNINALFPSGSVNFTDVDFANDFTMSGTPDTIIIQDSKFLGSTSITINGVGAIINITFSNIYGSTFTMFSADITNSTIDAFTFNGENLLITSSLLKAPISVANGGSYEIVNSSLEDCTFTRVDDGGGILVQITDSRMFKVTATLIDATVGYVFTDVDLFSTTINVGGVTINSFAITNSKASSLTATFSPAGASAPDTAISGCSFNNCTMNINFMQANVYTLTDSNFAWCTITSSDGASVFSLVNFSCEYRDIDFNLTPGTDYDLKNMSISRNRGYCKADTTFTGAANEGQAGTNTPIMVLIGQDVFKSVITKATISTVTGLTAGGGSLLSMGHTTFVEYIPATLVTTLNTDFQLKNEPTGVANNASVYTVYLRPTVADITAGSVESEVEFLIAP